jgi:hypothetical protein
MPRCYALCGRYLQLLTDWDPVIEWADRSLLPYASISGAPEQVATIACHYGVQPPPEIAASARQRIAIHLGREAEESTAADGSRLITAPEGVVYQVAGRRIDAFYPSQSEDALRDPTRLCREVLYNSLPAASWFEFHASAVTREGKAIVFAGPKGAGKTTLLCRLLSAGDRERFFDFLSNDRVWLEIDHGPVPRVMGSPMPVVIAYGTMSSIPELTGRLSMYRDGFNVMTKRWSVKAHEYTPREMADAFGCAIATTAEIAAFIELRRGVSNLLVPVEDETARRTLLRRCVRDTVDSYPNWMRIGQAPSERDLPEGSPSFPIYVMEFNPTETAITKCDESIINALANLMV